MTQASLDHKVQAQDGNDFSFPVVKQQWDKQKEQKKVSVRFERLTHSTAKDTESAENA